MKCKNCSYENPAGRTVCLICGEPLPEGDNQPAVEETIVMRPGPTSPKAPKPTEQVSPPSPPPEKAVEKTVKMQSPVTPDVSKSPAPASPPPPKPKTQPQKPAVSQKSVTSAPGVPVTPKKSRPGVLLRIIVILLIGAGVYFGYDWWRYESRAGKILRSSHSFDDCQKQFSGITDEKFIRRCLKNKSDWLRAASLRRAAEVGLAGIPDIIRKELNSPNSGVVLTQALLSLGMVGTNSDVSLISKFLKNNNSEVRLAAVEAIKLLGQEKDFSLLAPLLVDKAEDVRLAVLGLLKQKNSLAVKVDLINLLGQETSPKVVAEILAIIAELKQYSFQLLSVLSQRVEEEDFRVVISSFIVANQSEVSGVLIQDYDRIPQEVKTKVIDILCGVKNSELAKFLLKNLAREKDVKLKLSRIRFIGQSEYSQAVPVLKNILRMEKNPQVRKEIVLAIARLKK